MHRVLFVCLGNICRSPMAEGVFHRLVADRGLAGDFVIESAGTGGWHVGERPDRRTLEVLRGKGIHLDSVARQIRVEDGERFDWILTMDDDNLRQVRRLLPARHHDKVHPVLSIDGGGAVPDPYYGGPDGFDKVHDLLEPALDQWLDRILGDAS